MKSTLNKSFSLILAFGLFFTMTGLVHATNEHHASLSVETILKHNRHLLTNTTISEALSSSTLKEARRLFREAHDLFNQAQSAYKTGDEQQARQLANLSIRTFYESDKRHYGLH